MEILLQAEVVTLFTDSIKSQLIKSYEAGAELRFFKSKVGLDVFYI